MSAPGGFQRNRGAADRGEQASLDSPASLTYQVQTQLDRLAEELHITMAQQSAWDRYALRVIRFADDVARERYAVRRPADSGESALQQFNRLSDTAQNRATAIEEIAEAGRALYATLTPDQRPVADQRLATLTLALVSGAPMPGMPRRSDRPGSNAPAPNR